MAEVEAVVSTLNLDDADQLGDFADRCRRVARTARDCAGDEEPTVARMLLELAAQSEGLAKSAEAVAAAVEEREVA